MWTIATVFFIRRENLWKAIIDAESFRTATQEASMSTARNTGFLRWVMPAVYAVSPLDFVSGTNPV